MEIAQDRPCPARLGVPSFPFYSTQAPHPHIPAVTRFNVPISPPPPLPCHIQHSHSHIPIPPSPHAQACSLLQGHSGLSVQGDLPAWSFTCILALLPVYIHTVLGIFSIWILAAARPCSSCECKCLWVSQPAQGTHSWWPWPVPTQDILAVRSLLMPPCSVPLSPHCHPANQSSHGGRGMLPSSGFTPQQPPVRMRLVCPEELDGCRSEGLLLLSQPCALLSSRSPERINFPPPGAGDRPIWRSQQGLSGCHGPPHGTGIHGKPARCHSRILRDPGQWEGSVQGVAPGCGGDGEPGVAPGCGE